MKRRLCSLLLLSVFICSILTACGGSVSGPNNSYPSGTSKKDQITTSLDRMSTDYTTVTGSYGYGSNGFGCETTYYYKLNVYLTIENTGDIPTHVENSLFTAYWDNRNLTYYNEGITPIVLAPGEENTFHLVYNLNKSEYNSWTTPGHVVSLVIQYGGDSLAYVYETATREITVVQ